MIFNCLSPKLAQQGIKSFLSLIFFLLLTSLLLTGCFGGGGGSGSGSGTTVNQLPTANAGTAQTVNEKVLVALDGSASSDPDGAIVSYAWVQTAGTAAVLSNANVVKPTFTAPDVSVDEMLTFELTVTDNKGAVAKSAVNVAVTNIPAPHRGQFVDSPVSGLNWKTATRSGVTDANGYFEYDNPGETITFSIGEQELGTVGTDKTIHVFDLEQSSLEMASNKGTRLAQLLQTLDVDRDPTNGIQLTPEVKAKLKGASSINFVANADSWNAQMKSVASLIGNPVVSLDVAYTNASGSLNPNDNCAIPSKVYVDFGDVGGFDSKKLTCYQRARIEAFRSDVRPVIQSFERELLDDPYISRGEDIADETLKKAIDGSVIKNAFSSFVDIVKAQEDFEKSGMTSEVKAKIISGGANLAKNFVKAYCGNNIGNCQSNDNAYRAFILLLDSISTTSACIGKDLDKCGEYISTTLETSDLIAELLGGKMNLEEAKGYAKLITAWLKVLNDGVDAVDFGKEANVKGATFNLVGTSVEVAMKTATGAYLRDDAANARRSNIDNNLEITAEYLNVLSTCYGDRISIDCMDKAFNFFHDKIAQITTYNFAIWTVRQIRYETIKYQIARIYLEEYYKSGFLSDLYKSNNLELVLGESYGTAESRAMLIHKIARYHKIEESPPPFPVNVKGFYNEVFDIAMLYDKQVRSLAKDYLDGTYSNCSSIKMTSPFPEGQSGPFFYGLVGQSLNYTANLLSGSPQKYIFNWGDGSDPVSSDLAAAQHTFNERGYYSVSLAPVIMSGGKVVKQCNAHTSLIKIWSPPNISPKFAGTNTEVNFTVDGMDLPLTAILSMEDATCKTPTNRTKTGFNVICIPNSISGDKLITIKESIDGNVIDSRQSVNVVDASIDTDSDTMPDYWELQYGLDINVDDREGHLDDDKSTNIEEFHSGSDPSDKNSNVLRIYDITSILNKSMLAISWYDNAGQSYDLCVAEEEIKSTIQNPIDESKCTALTNGKWYSAVENKRKLFGELYLDDLDTVVPGISYHLVMVARDTTVIPEKITRVSNELVLVDESTTGTTTPNVTATPGDKQVTLNWGAIHGATGGYAYCYSKVSADCATYDTSWIDESGTTVTITGLDNDSLYHFRVVAKDANGRASAVSEEAMATPSKATTGATGKLNDTGITTCGHAITNHAICPQPDFPGQDAESGRDANQVTNNDADGHAGFSFTKISSTGQELPTTATEWSCVKDNVTGLIWEVKQGTPNNVVGDSGLHDPDDGYAWYEPDGTKNGGFAGYQKQSDYHVLSSDFACYGYTRGNPATYCNTKAYVDRVNTAGWCGLDDWRLPTREELHSIVNYHRYFPAIDTAWFPNTQSSMFWSASPSARSDSDYVWGVYFASGGSGRVGKYSTNLPVRLVRGRQ